MIINFTLIYFSVVGLAVLCGAAMYYAALNPPTKPSPLLKQTLKTFDKAFLLLVGAIIALMGSGGVAGQ